MSKSNQLEVKKYNEKGQELAIRFGLGAIKAVGVVGIAVIVGIIAKVCRTLVSAIHSHPIGCGDRIGFTPLPAGCADQYVSPFLRIGGSFPSII